MKRTRNSRACLTGLLPLEHRLLLALTNLFVDEAPESISNPSAAYVATGDFNGDGIPDLASSPGPWIAFGNGNGTFGPITQVGTGYSAPLIVADVNSDGTEDLIVIASTGPSKIYLGTASGAFITKDLGLGSNVRTLAFDDLNDDGRVDIASVEGSSIRQSKLYLGNGDGTFAAPTVIDNAPSKANAVAAADMTEDGIVDLVFTYDFVDASHQAGMVVYRGHGDGTFVPGVAINGSQTLKKVIDVDHDSHLDVVTVNGVQLKVRLGDGTGILGPAIETRIDNLALPVFIDFDGDELPDLITSNSGTFLSKGTGDGHFESAIKIDSRSGNGTYAAADFDRDGAMDLANSDSNVRWLRLMFGDGSGGIQQQQSPFTQINQLDCVISADFNGDGLADLASTVNATPTGIQIAFQRASGGYDNAFTPILSSNYTISSGDPLLAGDFNGDHRVDLVHLDYFGGVYLGNGDGTFASPVPFSTIGNLNARNLLVGDWNSDGLDDLFLGGRVLLSKGDGTFTPGQIFPWHTVAMTADFDGNKVADLVLLTSSPKAVSIFLGRGDGTFATVPALPVLDASGDLAVGQFDADGKPDVVVSGSGVRFFRGKGDGTLEAPVSTSISTSIRLAADVDDDGLLELLSYNDHPIYYGVLPDGTIAPESQIAGYAYINASLLATDFNSDGKLDVVAYGLFSKIILHKNVGQPLAPSVLTGRMNLDRLGVEFLFDSTIDATSLRATDLVITREDGTPGTFNALAVELAPDGRTVRYLLPSLPDGDYRYALTSGAVLSSAGLPSASGFVVRGFILQGDLNRDRVVNNDDLLTLAQNYGKTGKTFSQGNIDYSPDGLVGFDDLLLLAQRYGTTLAIGAAKPSSRQRMAQALFGE